MSDSPDAVLRSIQSPEALGDVCYRTPSGATFLRQWDIIRLSTTGNRVLVDAHGGWSAREEAGSFRYVTEYEIGEASVRVISHKEIPGKRD
jgi:hypothetical protein